MKFWNDVGPLVHSDVHVRLSFRVSFRRYSPLSLEVVEKRTNVKNGPQFLGETTPTFLQQTVSAIYCPPFGKTG